VELQRLEVGTVSALRSALRRDEWHVLHFIGHGRFDAGIGDGVLLFEGPQRRSRLVSGQDLGVLLHDHDSLKLVVLNACEGSRSDPDDAFSGAAQALIQQGLPAVVAMQTEVSDSAAIAISSEMYSAIADGYPLEGALAAARKAVYTDGNQTEWATPVLFVRTSGADVFEVHRQT
jgi:CHAT domain-containing protein